MTSPTEPVVDPQRLAQALVKAVRPYRLQGVTAEQPGRLELFGLVDSPSMVHVGYLDLATLTVVPDAPPEGGQSV